MSKNLDADRLDATTNRLQSQEAGSKGGADGQSADLEETPEAEYASASIDRIQNTILRVRAQAAAMRAAEGAPLPAAIEIGDEDPIEATIRRVQAQAAAAHEDEHTDGSSGAPALGAEDPIEATIRRVQAQAAEHADEFGHNSGVPLEPSAEDPIEATIGWVQGQAAVQDTGDQPPPTAVDGDQGVRFGGVATPRVREQPSALAETASLPSASFPGVNLEPAMIHVAESLSSADVERDGTGIAANKQPLEETPWPGRDERLLGEPASWETAAQRLEQGLQDTQREVRALASRIEALLPAIEQGTRGEAASAAVFIGRGLSAVPPPDPTVEDDDWDEAPSLPRMPFGAPPRPGIFRDPSPQTATAQQLVEDAAPAPVEAASGPTQLRAVEDKAAREARYPRQYRITVEDKRRGVDLVPLHRAMQSIDNVKDMSLLSYNNGVAIVALESIGAIEPEILRVAVARAMSREAKIEVHNEQTMVVKIQDE